MGPEAVNDVRGGGTLVAVKKTFKVHRRFDLDFNNIECTWVEIALEGNSTLIVGNHYFQPSIRTELLRNYVDFLETCNIDIASSKVLFLGDYNIPRFNFDLGVSENDVPYIRNKSDIVYSLFCTFNLMQSNYERILDTDSLLDLVSSNFPDSLSITKEQGLVDWDHQHPALLINICLPVFKPNFLPLVKCDYANGDYLGLYNYLSRYEFIDSEDPEHLVRDLTEAVGGSIQSFIPKKTIYPKSYPRWFSGNLIRLLKLKEKFHSKLKRQPNNNYFRSSFTKFRKLSKKALRADESKYKRKVESDLRMNPKFFWQYVQTQYKNQHELSLVQDGAVVPVERTPEIFSDHFASIYSSRNVNVVLDQGTDNLCFSSGSFTVAPPTVTVNDVIKAGKSLQSSRVAGSDSIPSFIVKGSINILAPILCKIFNLCLKLGKFPTDWKTSIVVPVPKNSNVNNVQNYRPISLLTNFSKVFEKIILNHVIFNVKNQLSPDQHGFLSGRSTATNLVSFLQYTATAVLDRRQVDTAYFDLSKAFDVVDHELLIVKLNKFGLSPLYVNFFQNYLNSRYFRVKVGNFVSSEKPIPCGVPQGSNLGPLLFVIFFDDIKSVIRSQIQIFADDLKVSRVINEPEDHVELQKDIDSVTNWCSDNGMHCNIDKTVIISYSRKHEVHYYNYKINNTLINRKHVHRDLGMLFDCKLNFDAQVQKVIASAKRFSGLVYWVTKSFRTPSTHSLLFGALVRSRMEYCSEVWGGLGEVASKQIEQIQKTYLRRVTYRSLGQSASYHLSLETYHLATLEARRKYKDILFVYKLINNHNDCSSLLSKIDCNVPRLNSRHYRPFRALPSNVVVVVVVVEI
ncbi:hypothetical protein WDU94_003620 [Cyamophila willieti]